MTPPPYEMRDKATGEAVPGFENMDAAPGKHIEVWAGNSSGAPQERISETSLVRPEDGGGETPPPDPNPEPPDPVDPVDPPITSGDGMHKVNNEAELRGAMQAAANGIRVIIDPSSPTITVSSKISVPVTKPNFYFDGSGLQIATSIANFDNMFEFTNGQYGFRLKNLFVLGDYPNRRCGDAFRFINAADVNVGAFYNFSITGIRIEHISGNGMYMQGAFEGSVDVLETNDIGKSGFVIESIPGSTVCQVNMHNCQLSRCDKWGAEQLGGADQVTWFSPKFVNNGMGGLHATDGIHLVIGPQGENTGKTLIVVDKQGWAGAEVQSIQVASDGGWTRNWVTNTGPTKYGIKCPAGAVKHTGVFKARAYGGGPVELFEPGSE